MQTRNLLLIPFLAVAFAPLACGGTGDTAAAGTSGTGGAAGTTTSSGTSMSTSTGAGGDASSTTSASTSGSTGSSGTGGGSSACAGYIDVTENSETMQHFASICAGDNGSNETMTAVGYHFAGGPFPGADELRINGCASKAAGSAGLRLRTSKVSAPGTFMDGDASYTDANGGALSTSGDPYKIVITKLDAPGGVIEGTFAATVTGPTDEKKTLTGSFHVCRVADELVP